MEHTRVPTHTLSELQWASHVTAAPRPTAPPSLGTAPASIEASERWLTARPLLRRAAAPAAGAEREPKAGPAPRGARVEVVRRGRAKPIER
jgi:hypothetical protein